MFCTSKKNLLYLNGRTKIVPGMPMNLSEEIADAVGHYDVAEESVYGMFPNLTLLSMLLASLKTNKSSWKSTDTFKDEYDYVIVGGGSAGSVLASRLSEEPCVSVLLLEAGGEPPPLSDVPAFASLFFHGPADWSYKTTPQDCGGSSKDPRPVSWNSGKVLGGSSVLNAMMHLRGNKKNYDDWEASGATGWSFKDVLPYFLKMEDNRNMDELDADYHGQGGPLTLEKPNYDTEIRTFLLKATAEMGFEIRDVNGERQTGIFDLHATTRNQTRCSAAKAYLDPARHRPNLDILTHAFATKILIRKTFTGQNQAYGVEFDHRNRTHIVCARKEVIICSGAVRTPQILMLSGIGPKEELKKFGIDVIVDLDVGKNLQDHCLASVTYYMNSSIRSIFEKMADPNSTLDYLNHRKGPFASPLQNLIVALINGSDTTSKSEDFPRQQVFFCEYIDLKTSFTPENLKQEKCGTSNLMKPQFRVFSALLQPYSRGEVTLNSTNPFDHPIINPNYYEDKRDLQVVIEGLKAAHAICTHPAMNQVQVQIACDQYPDCEKSCKTDIDEFWNCTASRYIHTFFHYSGTARMGSRDSSTSVVDPELRVIGVEGLRAVSGATMPVLPSANANAPILMMAEKAADLIKNNKNICCSE